MVSGPRSGSALAAPTSLTFVAVGIASFVLIELVTAVPVFRGRNWARVFAMAASCAAIVLQMGDVALHGVDVIVRTGLPGLCLDILLVLALSSEHALVYARRRHPR